jgi:hypothetical protein
MSKKLIAVASAAALALSALVGVAPANASAAAIAFDAATGSGTQADPYVSPVPAANTIVTDTTAMAINVTNVAAGDTVSVSISGTALVVGAQVTAASSLVDVTKLGASSLTKTITGSTVTADFWVYQTSTAAASVVTVTVNETDGGTKSTTTTTKYFKPSIGAAWTIKDVNAPATMVGGVTTEVSFVVTDVFGNKIEDGSYGTSTVSAGASITSGTATWDASRKVYTLGVTADSTDPFLLTVVAGSDNAGVGLGASNLGGEVRVINAGGSAGTAATNAQIAALTAQIATMRPKATSVTKKRYNTLARKWNAAFPSQAVKLKK